MSAARHLSDEPVPSADPSGPLAEPCTAPARPSPIPRSRWQGEEVPEPPVGLLAWWLARWAGDATGGGALADTGCLVHVAQRTRTLRQLATALPGMAPAVEVLTFPPWDCLPYDRAPPSRVVTGTRMTTLRRLAEPVRGTGRIVLTTVEATLRRIPAADALADAGFALRAGEALELDALREFLERTGWVVDERVDEPGEAAIRGSVIDLYPPDAASPCRLELDEGRIAAIRAYDPLSQRTRHERAALVLGPATELQPPEATLFDHLGPAARLVLDPGLDEAAESFLEQALDAYTARRALQPSENLAGRGGVVLEPSLLYLAAEEWRPHLAALPRVVLEANGVPSPAAPVPSFRATRDPRPAFLAYVAERRAAGDRVVLAAGVGRDRARLTRLVERGTGERPQALPTWDALAELPPGALGIAEVELPAGFTLPGLAVVAARDVIETAGGPDRRAAAEAALAASDLAPGDHVVDAEHGVGILRGLEMVPDGESVLEHLVLEYAGGDRLLVPALEIDRVWRYGSAAADVTLDRVDGEAWRARRAEVEAEIERTAATLTELAAARARQEGPEIRPPARAFARLTARFPYAETDDQTRAIEAALADLARGSPPMDRLVCGDVGYGKTEVALRAAAAVALAGKQVALLAPTTILVRQHLETFRRRFAGTGIRVEQLSRLARGKEATAVKKGLADGSVRVVVGTHALASPGLRFRDLGLVIIDEEQRFGTRHKAALRRLRQGVHVLTMTATPIPRTLQSALAGLVELSVLATPSVRRQPVRTFVLPFDAAIACDALLREHRRGGRSFVVVPRIADVHPVAERLARIVPELDVAVAHGRLKADALDDVVLAFANGRHDVLLCTSIIETGLDIPGADTMIVWRPERFGIAQLHQLRGRIGRGQKRAVAYFLHDPETPLPEATEERLQSLEALEGLGAGFAIAARDLDLRGAGDLLGDTQAGHLKLIGTGLYQHLLERALRRVRGETVPPDQDPELRLGVSLAIPDDYVPEPEVRLELYGRLGRLETLVAIDDLRAEIVDRFGPLPEGVEQLLAVAALRLRCRDLGIAKLEVGPKAAAVTFHPDAYADDAGRKHLARLGEAAGGDLRWTGERLISAQETATADERLDLAGTLLDRLERIAPAHPRAGSSSSSAA